jgi:hypothetical protein
VKFKERSELVDSGVRKADVVPQRSVCVGWPQTQLRDIHVMDLRVERVPIGRQHVWQWCRWGLYSERRYWQALFVFLASPPPSPPSPFVSQLVLYHHHSVGVPTRLLQSPSVRSLPYSPRSAPKSRQGIFYGFGRQRLTQHWQECVENDGDLVYK